MTPADALRLPEIPATLLVVGSNVNAMEIASVYAALGSRVTIVDSAPRLLPRADPDLVALLVQRLAAVPIDMRLSTTVTAITAGGDAGGTCGRSSRSGVRPAVTAIRAAEAARRRSARRGRVRTMVVLCSRIRGVGGPVETAGAARFLDPYGLDFDRAGIFQA